MKTASDGYTVSVSYNPKAKPPKAPRTKIPYSRLWSWAQYCRTILYGAGKLTETEMAALSRPVIISPGYWRALTVFASGFAFGTILWHFVYLVILHK